MPDLRRIVYVEDEPDIRELTEMALATVGGFDVKTFASGPEALAGIPIFEPDVILLDVMMPEMDGPEVLSRLSQSEELQKTPVIFITARSQHREIDELLGFGAIGVIPKPYDPLSVSDEIRAIYREHSSGLRPEECSTIGRTLVRKSIE